MPVAAQFLGDLRHAASVLADLIGEPASSPVGDEVSRERDAGIDLAPRTLGAVEVGTEEASLVPDNPRRSSVRGQVHERDLVAVLHPSHHPTLGTTRHRTSAFEVDGDRLAMRSQLP